MSGKSWGVRVFGLIIFSQVMAFAVFSVWTIHNLNKKFESLEKVMRSINNDLADVVKLAEEMNQPPPPPDHFKCLPNGYHRDRAREPLKWLYCLSTGLGTSNSTYKGER